MLLRLLGEAEAKEDEVLGNGAEGFHSFCPCSGRPSSSSSRFPEEICVNKVVVVLGGGVGEGFRAVRPAGTTPGLIRNHMEIAAVPSAALI